LRDCDKLSLPLRRPFYSTPNFFANPEKLFELLVYAKTLAREFATQHVIDVIPQATFLDP
jgi:hypothetical protein